MAEDTTMAGRAGTRERDLVRTAIKLGTATLHEAAGQVGALPAGIRRLTAGLAMAGRAVTASGPPRDNLWIHRAIYAASPGDVLVTVVGGEYEAGYWGEILSWAASTRGIGGVVIDGCARDGDRLTEIGVPIFARGLCMRGTSKRADGSGAINTPITIGGVVVNPGDFVVGDSDGVLVLPSDQFAETVERGLTREHRETQVISALRRGATTLELYGLPAYARTD